ncbi:MAG: hypothetical protein R2737_06520 [Candidatus Nanopelagicales bacterium]
MEPFLRQQFDLLLQEAAGAFVERAVHRCGGPQPALDALRADPESEGVWLADFVDAFFEEHLLDNPAGAAFVLQALERRTLPPDAGGSVAEVLDRLARTAFGDVLTAQAGQLLQRQLAFGG